MVGGCDSIQPLHTTGRLKNWRLKIWNANLNPKSITCSSWEKQEWLDKGKLSRHPPEKKQTLQYVWPSRGENHLYEPKEKMHGNLFYVFLFFFLKSKKRSFLINKKILIYFSWLKIMIDRKIACIQYNTRQATATITN